jgi:hypothetical protein
VDQLVGLLLERYGMAARGQIAQLQNDLRTNTQLYRFSLKVSADQPEAMAKDAVFETDILQFFTPWRERKRCEAYMNAVYARCLGRNAAEADRQEKLLADARAWAKADLTHPASSARDLAELKERTMKRTWDEFLPTHLDRAALQLGFRAFGSAIWEEGWPSIQDYAVEALVQGANPSDEIQPYDTRIVLSEGGGESEISQEAPPEQSRTQRRGGRVPKITRRTAIRSAINKHGDDWRDHLREICDELKAGDVDLGDFQGRKIDLGEGHSVRVSSWSDLELAEGRQLQSIHDVLRKYRQPLDQEPPSEFDPVPSS